MCLLNSPQRAEKYINCLRGLNPYNPSLPPSLFGAIRRRGLRPDRFSFIAAVKSCGRAAVHRRGRLRHGSLQVVEGKEALVRMMAEHVFGPWMEHYGCSVDPMARAGKMEAAVELLQSLPMEVAAAGERALSAAPPVKKEARRTLIETRAQFNLPGGVFWSQLGGESSASKAYKIFRIAAAICERYVYPMRRSQLWGNLPDRRPRHPPVGSPAPAAGRGARCSAAS